MAEQKPQPDVYVALLFIGVAALSLGCMFLWWSLEKYGFQLSP